MGTGGAITDELKEVVHRILGEEEKGQVAYIAEQWALALDGRDDHTLESAVPYVPVDLDAHGVKLSADDLIVDIGCLGGFGLYDFARRRRAKGLPVPRMLGVDIAPESVRVAEKIAKSWANGGDVRFVETTAESLGVSDRSVSLVVARGVIQYTRIHDCLRELVRVLKPGGHALIQWGDPSYYVWAVGSRPKDALYYATKLAAHAVFRVTGRQLPGDRFRDVPMTKNQFVRLARKYGFESVWFSPVPMRPMMLFRLRG